MEFNLEVQSDFAYDGSIPVRYTADGDNVSPPLELNNLHARAQAIVIIMDAPDMPRGTFTHWLIWNIPAAKSKIPAGIPTLERVQSLGNACQGRNDFGNLGYNGPTPTGGLHVYNFKVYTLEKKLDLYPGVYKQQLLEAMSEHLLQKGLLRSTYDR